MACGTGKTLTSLHIAEKMVGSGGLVLYLVPSISLIPQTMREWADNRSIPHRYIAVCSDHTAGNDEHGSITEIPIIPSTNVSTLQKEYKRLDRKSMNVVFSTYNSVEVASKALLEHDKNGIFDLVLFDEAHKTTGIERVNESYYLLAHHNPSPGKLGVPAKKRLYMTATPRVYKRSVDVSSRKKKNGVQQESLQVYSMDKLHIYGDEFYKLEFSDAVSRGLLSNYKIIMREVNKGDLYGKFIESGQDDRKDAASDYGDIDMDYLAKLGGVCKAVTYPDGDDKPPRPLQRVMVFHNLIKKSKIFAAHGLNMDKDKKPLKLENTTKKALSFDNVSKKLMSTDSGLAGIITNTRHVDGATNSRNRSMRIDWLRDSETDPKEIRVLSNARCLQEGVDVPALDAVAFMDPKKSPIDIIQSIGRVMRKQSGKDCGYVIIPIPVLEGDNPRHALDRNKKYEQINEILQAILAHDDHLRNILNNQMFVMTSASKKRKPPDQQELTPQLREWITKTIEGNISDELLEEIKTVLLELGDASYYKRVGEELGEQSVVIEEMLRQRVKKQPETAKIIKTLHKNLQVVVGSTMTREDAVKVLAQHAVMDRVFTELFPGYQNPLASALNTVLDKLNLRSQLKSLEKYYLKIKHDIEQFKEPEAKQEFIRIVYDSFFRGADRKAADKHGIVYTPIEIVDFIINSVQHVLKTEFGKSFDDRCVKVHDPFTGTGIFISRLLESGMISDAQMYTKYKNDIYASEIMLPAYYVAMANISSSYQKMKNNGKGKPAQFEDVILMDTFDQHPHYRYDARFRQKQVQLTDSNLEEAHARKKKQGMDSIDVIMTNPPYSGGQKTANEDNKNVSHPELEARIEETYIKNAPKGNVRGLYNSYVKAFRWASDRIGDSGVIGIITPSAYITGISEGGIRTCLKDEFTDVYCFDLRGNVKNVEKWREEGGKIFGSGSTVGTAILILVKNPKKAKCVIHYKDIGDYLSREEKLRIIEKCASVQNIDWKKITPDTYNDWVNQRGLKDKSWKKLLPIGSKSNKGKSSRVLFDTFSNGLKTHRDVWVYNSSVQKLEKNIKTTIDYCNKQDLDNFKKDPKKVAWSSELSTSLKKSPELLKFDKSRIRIALFRPFVRRFLYFDQVFVTAKYRIPSFFPNNDTKNPTILVPDKAGTFSTIVTNDTPDLNNITPSQSFPLRTKANKDTHTHTHTHSKTICAY